MLSPIFVLFISRSYITAEIMLTSIPLPNWSYLGWVLFSPDLCENMIYV